MKEFKLADYATRHTIGRRYGTRPDPHRSDFERDIGRILYSKAFRRLAFKTQVFSPSEGDHYRNRLTHTLETAQIARVVARRLRLDASLAEAIALSHDLGHPPFGHQGEQVLDDLMAPYGGFEHSPQNIRIVTLMEVKDARFPGLNLTYECIYGIAKSDGARAFLCQLYDLPESHRIETGEAQVANLADDLAYTATDFDDFSSYHNLSLEEIRNLKLELVDRCLPKQINNIRIAVSMCVRNMVSVLVGDLIETSLANIEAAGGKRATCEQVIAAIGLSPAIDKEYRQLATFLQTHMYHDAELKVKTTRGAESLRLLFAHEVEKRRLPPDDPEKYHDLCDYIAGMSDHYVFEQCEKLKEK